MPAPTCPSVSGMRLPELRPPMPGARVLVALSGGVDSAVAAWLLKEHGWGVEGATLRLLPPGDSCLPRHAWRAAESSIRRAESVCRALGIPHRVVEAADLFRDTVLLPFFRAYDTGLTPNPCVLCNPAVKWGALVRAAMESDCAHLATGHYARCESSPGRVLLLRGRDAAKDQSYALYRLDQAALKRTLFPLGGLEKRQVRRVAEELGVPGRHHRESQDICFIPRGSLGEALSRNTSPVPGPLVDRDGNLLGTHRGLPFYTVGQRKGLGVARGAPLYVISKDPRTNRLVVGPREGLRRRRFTVTDVCWVSESPPDPGARVRAQVELRFRSRPIEGEIRQGEGGSAEVTLSFNEQPVAPGQSAVWYRGDVLLGGGVIRGEEPGSQRPDASSPPFGADTDRNR